MTITVHEFDAIAQVSGLNAALAAAEKAGGVTGTRTPSPAPQSIDYYGDWDKAQAEAAAVQATQGTDWMGRAADPSLQVIPSSVPVTSTVDPLQSVDYYGSGYGVWDEELNKAAAAAAAAAAITGANGGGTEVPAPPSVPPAEGEQILQDAILVRNQQILARKRQNWIDSFGDPGRESTKRKFEEMNFSALQSLLGDSDFTALFPIAETVYNDRKSRGMGDVPWREITGNLERRILQRILQNGYTAEGVSPGAQGDYGALTAFFNDIKNYLEESDSDSSDANVYATMDTFIQNATDEFKEEYPTRGARGDIPTFAGRYNKSRNVWINAGRPARIGGNPTVDPKTTPDPKSDVSTNAPDSWLEGSTQEDWDRLSPELKDKFFRDFPSDTVDDGGFGEGWMGMGLDWPGTTADTAEPDISVGDSIVTRDTPATPAIFSGMQTQEQFPADVFRRFLSEQVSPSGEPRTLSPFMMRGAQELRPQLMSEYNASFFDPNTWSPEGPTTTFADWLRAGERPTRQGLFDRLGDIGSIVAGGDQALNAPGLSVNEALRRADIQNRFGMDTEDSRKLLKGMFTTAALSGVAPAFRYPIQAAAENLFQSQRAAQPEKSFLSFLNERL